MGKSFLKNQLLFLLVTLTYPTLFLENACAITPKDEYISPIRYSVKNNGKIKFRGLKSFFKEFRWITYSPSVISPGKEGILDDSLFEKDLRLLRSAGFDGIVTYSARGHMALLPKVARRLGFKGVIMGIWDPEGDEIDRAISSAPWVDAFCIGNEGLHNDRYPKETLISSMQYLRLQTKKPVSTSETLDIVLSKSHQAVWEASDWIFVIAHFIFDEPLNSKDPHKGVHWLYQMEKAIQRELRPGKPIVFKEVGFPTAGADWATEDSQKILLKRMSRRTLLYCTFEAFDQPWKMHLPIEPHWGLFTKDRLPKTYANYLLDQNSSK